jgi:hypothetical protein
MKRTTKGAIQTIANVAGRKSAVAPSARRKNSSMKTIST